MTQTSSFQIAPFVGCDLPGLVAAWNESNWADPITPRRFVNMFLMDVNFDAKGLLVAKRGGKVVGASYAVHRRHASERDNLDPESGWILFFFTAPSDRGTGLGRELVCRSIEWLEEKGATSIFFSSYTPNYLLPGLDTHAYPGAAKLLEQFGFEKQYEAVAMDRLLADYRVPMRQTRDLVRLEAEGYQLATATDCDLTEVLRLAGDHFNPDWERAIREAVVQGMPAENISIVRDPNGALVGWAMHGTYEGIVDRFGPFGVLDSQRGKGLGRVLLHHCLTHMKASGAHSAWFLWTGETTAAGFLYLNEGFAITRRFSVMKRVSPAATPDVTKEE